MDRAFVVHPGLQMPTYFFYNSWRSISSLGLHTNFGVCAFSWSYFSHFLGFLWMKQSEFFPGTAVGILSSVCIFSSSPELMVLDKRTHLWSFPLELLNFLICHSTCLLALHDLTKCISMNWLLGLHCSKILGCQNFTAFTSRYILLFCLPSKCICLW